MALFGRPSERDEARAASWAEWFRRQNPFALASLPLSVFSLTHAGTLFVDELAGVALGVIGLLQLAKARDLRPPTDDETPNAEGHWLAWGGIAVGLASLALALVIYFVLPHRRTGG
jgi:4-amino-4-deoxy-L-arabinose transferase-like glycosyltransferase